MANLPSRPPTALPGSVFMDSIMKMGPTGDRDDLIVKEILRGNFPEFLRNLVPITITDKGNTIIYKVMPDYLSIGSDAEYTRVPISGPSAQRIADGLGMLLPTPRISDQIYDNAKVKLAPKPLSGMSNLNLGGKTYTNQQFMKSKMSDTDAFDYHNKVIQEQLGPNYNPGDLVAGHKKDIVLSNDLAPGRLAIHGLHLKGGTPLQPGGISKHDANYKDYSHGVRLIDNDATLNGQNIKLSTVLKNPKYAYLVNTEGALKQVAYSYEGKPEGKPETAVAINEPPGDQSDRLQFLQRLNDYLSKINLT
jgi:hypothetical protein